MFANMLLLAVSVHTVAQSKAVLSCKLVLFSLFCLGYLIHTAIAHFRRPWVCCAAGPAGMKTNETAIPSSTYLVTHGFTDPRACVTKAGHGYNGRSAPKCAVGFWNDGNNYAPCNPCDPGLTTASTGSDKAADCKTALGFGYHDLAVVPCPLGECITCFVWWLVSSGLCALRLSLPFVNQARNWMSVHIQSRCFGRPILGMAPFCLCVLWCRHLPWANHRSCGQHTLHSLPRPPDHLHARWRQCRRL